MIGMNLNDGCTENRSSLFTRKTTINVLSNFIQILTHWHAASLAVQFQSKIRYLIAGASEFKHIQPNALSR
jgi:hypothetical protein